jgi:hypothetical protein
MSVSIACAPGVPAQLAPAATQAAEAAASAGQVAATAQAVATAAAPLLSAAQTMLPTAQAAATAAAPALATAQALAGKLDPNAGSEAELGALLQGAGVPESQRVAQLIVAGRPYPTDDPTYTRLREQLTKGNVTGDALTRIIGILGSIPR